MSIIQLTDFEKGILAIGQNKHNTPDLQDYIDRFEAIYFKKIVSDRIYIEYLAATSHPKNIALLTGYQYTDAQGVTHDFKGIKEALKFFIWVMFIRDNNEYHTGAGTAETQNENSQILQPGRLGILLRNRYNSGVDLARPVNEFIKEFKDYKTTASSITLVSGNEYLVEIEDTKFLANGDTVKINNTDHVISDLINNISFKIESSSDITGNSKEISWVIFGDFDLEKLEYNFFNGSC